MSAEDTILFFASVPTFQDLDPSVVREMLDSVVEESYPRGTTLVDPDDPTWASLRIIKKGAVKVTIRFVRNDEAMIDYRGEGDIIDCISLLTGDSVRGEIAFLEDTTCYRIERRTVLRLLQQEPAFARQFFISFLNKYVAKSYRELGKKKLFYGGGDRLLFTTPVGELISKNLVSASEDISIRQAAQIMAENRISSLVLLNALGLPAGIITNKDLRDKVVSKGRDTGQPVKRIQSLSLVKAEASEHCAEALFKMIHYNIHHLLVLDNGRLKGIITTHDLMKLQGVSPISVVREIEEKLSLEGLAVPARKIHTLVGLFLQEGVKATHILRIVTEIQDRLIRRLLELTQKKLGTPPLPYCFLALGDAGRREQTFLSIQNSALIYDDPPTEALEKESTDYFQRFLHQARDGLKQINFPPLEEEDPCAFSNRCRPFSSWEKSYAAWINQATPRSIDDSLDFFDFRCLFGEERMAQKLRDSVHTHIQTAQSFIRTMALAVIKTSPPLSAFRRFVLEKKGDHRGHFDLKKKGITPLVDILRLLALENGIRETATPERIMALRSVSPLIQDCGQELAYAFELIYGFWLQHRYDQVREGLAPHPYLNPKRLNNLEKKALREAFSLISEIQAGLLEKHRPLKY